jgi:thiamine biosynthesis lipoprotein
VVALNAGAGRAVPVSADTRLLVARAVDAWRLTGGSFDPTLLDDLLRVGYDRSFEQLDESRDVREVFARRRTAYASSCTDIVVDDCSVTLPIGLAFDAGGIGKGLAADIVAAELLADGVAGACVNIGGDLRVLGDSPEGFGWTLAIEHPYSTTPIALIGLTAGAIATSSVLRRVWTRNGRTRHHLIDPATGEPSESDLALASVVAGEAWTAEVLAKGALLRGRSRAFDLLDDSMAALVVDHEGRVTATDTMSAFVDAHPLPTAIEFDLQEKLQ